LNIARDEVQAETQKHSIQSRSRGKKIVIGAAKSKFIIEECGAVHVFIVINNFRLELYRCDVVVGEFEAKQHIFYLFIGARERVERRKKRAK
jgi:hypothetical protein